MKITIIGSMKFYDKFVENNLGLASLAILLAIELGLRRNRVALLKKYEE